MCLFAFLLRREREEKERKKEDKGKCSVIHFSPWDTKCVQDRAKTRQYSCETTHMGRDLALSLSIR